MAGNNSIQVLRGSRDKISQSSQQLLDGQLLYNTTDNYLTVGGGASNDVSKLPIVCREIRGYAEDTSENKISANENKTEYSIKYDPTSGKIQYTENVTNNYYDNGSIIQKKEYTSSNIIDAEGKDSIILRYSSDDVDDLHYGNANTGESAVVFGEANSNNANRALIAGKLNVNSGANAIVGGLKNTVDSNCINALICGNENIVKNSKNAIVSGYSNILTNGEDTILSGYNNEVAGIINIVSGYNNKLIGETSLLCGTEHEVEGNDCLVVGYSHSVKGNYSAAFGRNADITNTSIAVGYNLHNAKPDAVVVGKNNYPQENGIFTVGNGISPDKRHNALVVNTDSIKLYNNTFCSQPVMMKKLYIGESLSTLSSASFSYDTQNNLLTIKSPNETYDCNLKVKDIKCNNIESAAISVSGYFNTIEEEKLMPGGATAVEKIFEIQSQTEISNDLTCQTLNTNFDIVCALDLTVQAGDIKVLGDNESNNLFELLHEDKECNITVPTTITNSLSCNSLTVNNSYGITSDGILSCDQISASKFSVTDTECNITVPTTITNSLSCTTLNCSTLVYGGNEIIMSWS